MFKSSVKIIISSLLFFGCSSNLSNLENENNPKKIEREKVSKELLDDVLYIVFLLKQNNLADLNARFIHPKIGYYEVYKSDIGNKKSFKHLFAIEEISNSVDSFEVKEELVTFNCSPYSDAYYGWSKDGVFLTTDIQPYLFEIIKNNNKNDVKKTNEEEYKILDLMEKTSYEVIVTNNIILHLTKIENKWYITLVDKLKTDCSH